MVIFYLSRFSKQYKKLSRKIKDSAEKKEKVFRRDPFDPLLRTHKLHGELNEFWAFWINNKYRIIFDFLDKNTVRFFSVGTHDIY